MPLFPPSVSADYAIAYRREPPTTRSLWRATTAVAQLRDSRTEAALRSAFAREAANNLRLLHFARRADIEGWSEAAAALRELAEGSTGHALGLLELLEETGDPVSGAPMGSTDENLRGALTTEGYESSEMFPSAARVAAEEGLGEVAAWFELLAAAEAEHGRALRRALGAEGAGPG
jgi:rubrerythrin